MSASPEEGGTKLQKRRPQQIPQQPQQIPQRQQIPQQQQVPQQQQQFVQQTRQPPEQVFMQEQIQMGSPEPRGSPIEIPIKVKKSLFGSTSSTDNTKKYALLVAVIFIILNSKIVWRQIIKLPFMGSVEPSMIALIINSLLAGLAFYIVSTFIIK
jgi:hypothetical protein